MAENADVLLEVEGMMCQKNCGTTVYKALKSLAAVHEAVVSYPDKRASVWIKPEKYAISSKVLIEAIEDVGYDAKVISDNRKLFNDEDDLTANEAAESITSKADLIIHVHGIDATDATVIERTLLTIEGVFNVVVDIRQKAVQIWGYAERSKVETHLRTKGYRTITDDGDGIDEEKGVEMVEVKSPLFVPAKSIQLKINGSKLSDDIVEALNRIPHVRATVLHRMVTVEFEEEGISERRLLDILEDRGWSKYISKQVSEEEQNVPTKKEFRYSIRGMSCGNCASKIEKALAKMPGVVSASVSVMTHQGLAVVDDAIPNASGPRDLMDRVKDLGYECDLITEDSQGANAQDNDHELKQWRRLLYFSLVFGVPVFFLHLLSHANEALMMFLMQPTLCHGGIQLGQVLMIVLNSIMLVTVGAKFYRGAFVGAMHGSFGMDFLVMTGTSITFIYSSVKIFYACQLQKATDHIFFEVTGMLLLFVTIGKYIEAYAKGRSASSVAELLKLQPRDALLVSDATAAAILHLVEGGNGTIRDEDAKLIAVDLLQKGDVVKVLPGGRIPTDGRVVHGSSYVDESTITGEANPVRRERGDEVFGSTVNQDSCLYISVTSYGADSALAQIVRLVESAQMNKAPVQQFADRLAGVFTPIVLFLALVTFLVWYGLCSSRIVPASWFEEEYNDPLLFSLLFSISVVVISCPCALGLATPTAIMVGTTVGAANGILIKGGLAFEVAHKVDTIVFDKTGTLTEGKPSMTDAIVIANQLSGKVGEDSLIVLAATAEQRSEHPLAQAVMRAAQARGISPFPLAEDAAVTFVGSGVSCESPLGRILIGNRGFMKAQDIVVNAVADAAMWNLEIQGKTAVCVAVNQEVYGVLGLADVPKREADSAVRTLRAMGIDIWMLTGDNVTTAEALAHKLDISQDRVLAGMLPQDKVAKVRELQEAGHVVAMIGDGVNDSPALAQADLGVAIGAGTQIAIEAASMVLVRSNLHDLVVSFDLAKVVFRRIRWNFMWAMIYNILAVPFAAGVWFPWTHILLPPHYAGLSMALSSISVVISSMMLMRYRRPPLHDDHALLTGSLSPSSTSSLSYGLSSLRSDSDDEDHDSMQGARSASSFWSGAWGSSSSSSGRGVAAYNQLPRDEREWELSLGVELGLGRAHDGSSGGGGFGGGGGRHGSSGREKWNSIRDDVV